MVRMDALIPWQAPEDCIRPAYPKSGRGRHPYPLSSMLRGHCVQLFYNLSDPVIEDLFHEPDPARRFTGVKLSGPLPDENTILNFRHSMASLGRRHFHHCSFGHSGKKPPSRTLRPAVRRPVVRTAFSPFNGPFRCLSLCSGPLGCKASPAPQQRYRLTLHTLRACPTPLAAVVTLGKWPEKSRSNAPSPAATGGSR